MKLKTSYTLLIIALAFLAPILSHAQAPTPPDPNDVPLDGGLSLALAAGAGYLVKRRHDSKKKKNRELLP
jgi:hypothetical protein